ncbi:DUF92 domain-containing protein [Aspergillus sp. HF37]|nr:DUF92 domain-containing protein [Aspergillus sp. HF37]
MNPLLAVPAILLLVHRAWSRQSLTPLGLAAAAGTAVIHALHPSPTPFALLVVFYLAGTKATKVNHAQKAGLTLSATGSEGGEERRTHIQVLANSVVASILVLVDVFGLGKTRDGCFSPMNGSDLAMVGIVGNYAAVAADTLSSELGILSPTPPRLLTSASLRVVPRGTNGGVTLTGLAAGVSGAFAVAATSAILLPFCAGRARAVWVVGMTGWGGLGSVLDSVLGGVLQASVVDKRSGKVVEGTGGMKVLVHPSSTKPGAPADVGDAPLTADSVQLRHTEAVANTATLRGSRATGSSERSQEGRPHESRQESRRVESGRDVLDNNAVNVLMAATMSVGAMGIAWLSA